MISPKSKLQAAGRGELGCRPSPVGCRPSAIGHRLSAVGHRPSAVGHWLSAIGYRLCHRARSPQSTAQFLFLAALLLAGTPALRAQPFALDWGSIDGGGGASSGGGFAVSGAIAQPDTGAMSGGAFTVQGGLWNVLAVAPTPGAPTLTVSRSGQVLKIAWPKPADGWVLESSPALSGAGLQWAALTQAYQDDGTNLYLTFTAPPGAVFFRLHKP